MKKERRYGVIHIESDKSEKFINAGQALMAMQALQYLVVFQGYLTTSTINIAQGRIELVVHLNDIHNPNIPLGYMYTWKDISSHEYWSNATNQIERIRCITYNFEFYK